MPCCCCDQGCMEKLLVARDSNKAFVEVTGARVSRGGGWSGSSDQSYGPKLFMSTRWTQEESLVAKGLLNLLAH